jgi:phosphomethylpyrimidine synthase
MATQIELARKKRISPAVTLVARKEAVPPEEISQKISDGRGVILVNNPGQIKPVGIGSGLRVKVNANIGTSEFCYGIKNEIAKLKAAIAAGADTVMDLSTGGDLRKILQQILKNSSVPVGTVPIYEAAATSRKKGLDLGKISPELLFEVIERQAASGVSFVTVHCGVTEKIVALLEKFPRKMGMVSRGGAILLNWIKKNKKENPLYENFNQLLKIARKYDLVLSLGDGLRPGCIEDATDKAQVAELLTLAELAKEANRFGVMVMIEGPGHLPLGQIETNIKLQKSLCHGAPFYVLGPLVTDSALGYDHIAGAIGAAVAGLAGADFLCYVTPAEHLALPNVDDVREGVIASRLAAHAVDLARGQRHAFKMDQRISRARRRLDWRSQIKNSLYPPRAKEIYQKRGLKNKKFCSMCGQLCALRIGGGI